MYAPVSITGLLYEDKLEVVIWNTTIDLIQGKSVHNDPAVN